VDRIDLDVGPRSAGPTWLGFQVILILPIYVHQSGHLSSVTQNIHACSLQQHEKLIGS